LGSRIPLKIKNSKKWRKRLEIPWVITNIPNFMKIEPISLGSNLAYILTHTFVYVLKRDPCNTASNWDPSRSQRAVCIHAVDLTEPYTHLYYWTKPNLTLIKNLGWSGLIHRTLRSEIRGVDLTAINGSHLVSVYKKRISHHTVHSSYPSQSNLVCFPLIKVIILKEKILIFGNFK
jgi:hypothetical protein